MPLNLATTAPGFTEAMQLVHKGEKAMLWLPPEIGYKGQPQGDKPARRSSTRSRSSTSCRRRRSRPTSPQPPADADADEEAA